MSTVIEILIRLWRQLRHISGFNETPHQHKTMDILLSFKAIRSADFVVCGGYRCSLACWRKKQRKFFFVVGAIYFANTYVSRNFFCLFSFNVIKNTKCVCLVSGGYGWRKKKQRRNVFFCYGCNLFCNKDIFLSVQFQCDKKHKVCLSLPIWKANVDVPSPLNHHNARK